MADALEIYRLSHKTPGKTGNMHYRGLNWSWTQDNTSSYTNVSQIQYNISQMQNSNGRAPWSRGFFTIPVTATATNIPVEQSAAISWKSGHYHIIDSFSFKFCGVTVNSLCKLTNFAQTIRTLLTADPMKLSQSLPLQGFFLDTPETNLLAATGSSNYFVNNKVLGTSSNAPASCTGAWANCFPTTNQGLIARIKAQNWKPDGTLITASTATTLQMFQSSFSGTTQSIAGVFIIPLSQLCGFFSEENMGFPFLNGTLNATLTVNQGSITVNTSGACRSSTFAAGTCPIMVTDAGLTVMTADTVLTVSVGNYLGTQSPTRFYLPIVQLNPSLDLAIKTPVTRVIRYRDLQHFQLNTQGAGSSINWNLNTIPGLKRLFIFPLLAASVQPGNIPSYGNATSACPGMLDTNLPLTTINLSLNGINLFTNPIQYLFENYEQLVAPNLLNSDQCPYTAGGLLPFPTWARGNLVYVFDCTRAPNLVNVEPNSPVAAIFTATNSSGVSVDIHCFAEVEVAITLTETPSSSYAG